MGKNSVGMVILLSVLLFGQCKEKKGNEIQETRVIRVDMDRKPIEIQKTGLIRDYRLIQLDTPEEALIGEIDQVIVFGQYIYIADYSKSKAVFIFDTTGHFLNKIDRYGRAGDEYMQLRSLWVDTLRRTLNFISRVDKKWFIYDPEGGKLLEVRNLPKAFMQVVCDGTVRFGYSGNYREDASQPYNVWCLDSLGGVERGFFEIPAGWESSLVGSGNALSLYKGQTDYVIPMDFHIYRIAGENLTCPWYFDFGAYRWPSPDVTREQRQEILRNGQEYVDRICEFQETDRFLLATVIFKGQTRIIVYDKIKDKFTESLINFNQSIVTDNIKANADFQYKSGKVQPVIRRISTGKCCKWCSSKVGTYPYSPNMDTDVFRRHANCRCLVEYDNGSGIYQNAHSKRFYKDRQEEIKKIDIERRKELDNKQNNNKRILDNARKSGIIKGENKNG